MPLPEAALYSSPGCTTVLVRGHHTTVFYAYEGLFENYSSQPGARQTSEHRPQLRAEADAVPHCLLVSRLRCHVPMQHGIGIMFSGRECRG